MLITSFYALLVVLASVAVAIAGLVPTQRFIPLSVNGGTGASKRDDRALPHRAGLNACVVVKRPAYPCGFSRFNN